MFGMSWIDISKSFRTRRSAPEKVDWPTVCLGNIYLSRIPLLAASVVFEDSAWCGHAVWRYGWHARPSLSLIVGSGAFANCSAHRHTKYLTYYRFHVAHIKIGLWVKVLTKEARFAMGIPTPKEEALANTHDTNNNHVMVCYVQWSWLVKTCYKYLTRKHHYIQNRTLNAFTQMSDFRSLLVARHNVLHRFAALVTTDYEHVSIVEWNHRLHFIRPFTNDTNPVNSTNATMMKSST